MEIERERERKRERKRERESVEYSLRVIGGTWFTDRYSVYSTTQLVYNCRKLS